MPKSKASIPKYQETLILHKVSFSWSAFPLNTCTAHFSGQMQKLLTWDSLHHSLLKALEKHAKIPISPKSIVRSTEYYD